MTHQKLIETWKLDLERLFWSYHENGRPDGKTGVIGNPKTIEQFIEKIIAKSVKNERKETIKMCDNLMIKVPPTRAHNTLEDTCFNLGILQVKNNLVSL